jgi:hypothetical protein
MRFKRLHLESWSSSAVNPGSLRLVKPRFFGHASRYRGPETTDLGNPSDGSRVQNTSSDNRFEIELTALKTRLT